MTCVLQLFGLGWDIKHSDKEILTKMKDIKVVAILFGSGICLVPHDKWPLLSLLFSGCTLWDLDMVPILFSTFECSIS